MKTTKHTIDAKGKKLGRIATEAATYLMGKNDADFVRNKVMGAEVHITNASLADISEKKLSEKIYKRYSGFASGLKKTPMNRKIEEKGYSEIFRIAVKGMLPKNRLQAEMLKRLTISE